MTISCHRSPNGKGFSVHADASTAACAPQTRSLTQIDPITRVNQLVSCRRPNICVSKPEEPPPMPLLRVKRIIYPETAHTTNDIAFDCEWDGNTCIPQIQKCATDQVGSWLGNACAYLEPPIDPPPYPVTMNPLHWLAYQGHPIIDQRPVGHYPQERTFLGDLTEAGSTAVSYVIDQFGKLGTPPRNVQPMEHPCCHTMCPAQSGLLYNPRVSQHLTHETGNPLIDGFNKFMDRFAARRESNNQPESLSTEQSTPVADTSPQPYETGIAPIDSLNKILDDYFAPPAPKADEKPRNNELPLVRMEYHCANPKDDGSCCDSCANNEPCVAPETVEVKPRVPQDTSWSQAVKCWLNCRGKDTCSFGQDVCAGQIWDDSFGYTAHRRKICRNPDHKLAFQEGENYSLIDRMVKGAKGLLCGPGNPGGAPYPEKPFERFIPEFYDRQGLYCPYCSKNRYTGRERASLRDHIRTAFTCTTAQAPDDLLDFDLEQFIPYDLEMHAGDACQTTSAAHFLDE